MGAMVALGVGADGGGRLFRGGNRGQERYQGRGDTDLRGSSRERGECREKSVRWLKGGGGWEEDCGYLYSPDGHQGKGSQGPP